MSLEQLLDQYLSCSILEVSAVILVFFAGDPRDMEKMVQPVQHDCDRQRILSREKQVDLACNLVHAQEHQTKDQERAVMHYERAQYRHEIC